MFLLLDIVLLCYCVDCLITLFACDYVRCLGFCCLGFVVVSCALLLWCGFG